jgi:hypothetical protein
MAVGTCCAAHTTSLYPQKLALTSPTSGDSSFGIVRLQTKATEFALLFEVLILQISCVLIKNVFSKHCQHSAG